MKGRKNKEKFLKRKKVHLKKKQLIKTKNEGFKKFK
jgi:hypothetical protein